jgi:imidazolonepropionase-like amidohydrolase
VRLSRPLLVLAWLALPAAAAAQTHAFTNARVIPVSGPAIEKGTLVVRDGQLVAVGANVQIPQGAEVHDLSGKTVMPGLVDTHSHIAGPSGGDQSAALHPDARVIDSINVRSTGIRRALAGGITTVNIMPGSGLLLSGQTIYLKLRQGGTVDDFLITLPDGSIAGGIKMANGTNPLRTPGGTLPNTRARSASLVRAQFIKAQEYRTKLRDAGDDASKRPARDLSLEALVDVLDRKRVVHFHTHRHDDIITVLRIAKEFGFTPVLQHVSEGWKVAEEIAKAGAPASIIMIDAPGGKLETVDVAFKTGGVLEKAGVNVGFHTDDYITDSRLFLRSAGLAVRAGMSRDKALYGMTMAGARMLGLDSRIGTLEAGKDADFIVLSGDPLSVYTHVEQTWVEGKKVYDRSNPDDRKVATGGYRALRDEALELHVDGEGQ